MTALPKTEPATGFEPDIIDALKTKLSGTILLPGNDDYDTVRRVHNGTIDKYPALIVRCQGTADVVEALAFGIQHNLDIAIRGGGHNVTGRAVCNDGLMIDLSLMKGIWVDPRARRVRAQAGVCWGEFNQATQLHGLATTGGAVGTTGIAGLTLGGGFGYLMGKYGYTVDNLRAVEMVTASGEVLTASDENNTDLFWALRGGGGNFGIVTSFDYELYDVGPTIQGGMVAFDFDDARASLTFLKNFADSADEEMAVISSFSHSPDGSGRQLAAVVASHCGKEERAKSAMEQVRSIASPVVDRLGPIAYSDLNRLLDTSFPKLALNYWKSCFVETLNDEVMTILIEQFQICPSPMSKLIVECPHGAALRPAPDAMAFANRRPGFSVLILSQWQETSASEVNIAWARETFSRLTPFQKDQAYSNYLDDDENPARIHHAFGGNFERLRAIKTAYDPKNIFRLNQNILPK